MDTTRAAPPWAGPPLVLQIMGLLLAGLVVAQLVTLALTLLLPPEPRPQYGLDDIARRLSGADVDARGGRPLQRITQAAAPDPQGPGWLTSERSRLDLAALLGRSEADVKLYFFTPLPFAGTTGPMPLDGGRAPPPPRKQSAAGRGGADGSSPSADRFVFEDYQVAQAGPVPTGPPTSPPNSPTTGPQTGPRPGAPGPNIARPGPAMPAFPQLPPPPSPPVRIDPRLLDPPMPAALTLPPTISQSTVAPSIPLGAAPATAIPGAVPDRSIPPGASVLEKRALDVGPGQAGNAPTSASPATNVQGPAQAFGASPADGVAPTGASPNAVPPGGRDAVPLSRPLPLGNDAQRAQSALVPSASARAPIGSSTRPSTGEPTPSPPPPLPAAPSVSGSAVEVARTAPPHASGVGVHGAASAGVGAAGLAVNGLGTAVDAPSASTALPVPPATDRRPPADSPATAAAPARGLFGLAPAPFVEGDFVAAMRLADGGWAVVQPTPEPFPNAWQRRVLLWFGISAAVVAPLGWLFSRRLVRPISGFALAAEQLGRDPTAPILALEGPAEVGRAAHAFNRMQSRLRSFVDDRTAMIGAISHDLRTPLTRMRFRIEDVPDELREGMLHEVEEMEQMISSVLAFIRDASERGSREMLDLSSIVEDVVEDAVFVGKDVTLQRSEQATVEVDAIGMRRLLGNLVENAVKYGDRAQVRLFTDRQDAVAEVSDEGPGLSDAELERVFQPFYRSADARASDKQGSGLGLAVCRSIARAHGGDVLLMRGVRGLIAQVRLPLAYGVVAA